MFFLQIQEYFLPILAFIAFSFGEKFGYFASDCRERHFLVPYRPSSLIFRQIYHPSTSFPSKYTIESMVYCSHLPNLVRVTKNEQEDLSQSETAKYFEWIIIATIINCNWYQYILPNHNLWRNCQCLQLRNIPYISVNNCICILLVDMGSWSFSNLFQNLKKYHPSKVF